MYSRLRGVLAAGMLAVWSAGPVAAQTASGEPRQIVVRLAEELFAPLIERPIDEVLPVDEEILGVQAVGQARVVGEPDLVLADDPAQATFRVTVTGTVVSQTVGRKGPVKIHSTSTTAFTATKRVSFQPGRGFVGNPAEIEAQSSSQTDRIVPDRRGVLGRAIERRAWRRVDESRAEVNQIVQAKAEVKIREAFDRLLDARLARLNRRVDQRYLVAALLGGEKTPHYRCATRDGSLVIVASADPPAGDGRGDGRIFEPLAALRSQPPVQVWVAESVIGERLAAALRGVDLARQLWAGAAGGQPAPATSAADSSPSRRTYDFSAIGNWIVLHADGPTSIDTASPAAAEIGLTSAGPPADSAGGQ